MNRSSSKAAGVVLLSGILVCVAAQPVEAAELEKETAVAFDRYFRACEGRIKSELHKGLFLFIDELPETRQVEAYAQLREGQVLVKQVNTKEEWHPIEVPYGLIHDWIGLLFIRTRHWRKPLLSSRTTTITRTSTRFWITSASRPLGMYGPPLSHRALPKIQLGH